MNDINLGDQENDQENGVSSESNGVNDSESNDEELGNAGISALRKERAEVKRLKKELAELKAGGNESDLTLKEQLSFLTNGNNQLTKKIEQQKQHYEKIISEQRAEIESNLITNKFEKACLAEGLDPSYLELLQKSNISDLRLVDDKITHKSGVELNEWIESKKAQYPDLFKVKNPGGVGANGGSPPDSKSMVVSRSDPQAFFKNLSKIASGEAKTVD